MDSQSSRPWERQEGEPNRWYQRFTEYRLMGPNRSVLGAYNQERVRDGKNKSDNCAPGSWRQAARAWSWQMRAVAWDEFLAQEKEAEWERRRAEQREREWSLGTLMQERAKQALELGIYYDEKGEIAGVRLPELKASDVPKMAETGSKLVRLATGQPTDQVMVNVSDESILRKLLPELASDGAGGEDQPADAG